MSSSIKPALERMDQALQQLETSVVQFLNEDQAPAAIGADDKMAQLVAHKLDSAIGRLEELLAEE